ncbi:hypothetical protein AnigIFM56816_000451 [Aspergillus niger]|nr:hypothetical protein AnigIFM56816_000451 [Aspergillus niger]
MVSAGRATTTGPASIPGSGTAATLTVIVVQPMIIVAPAATPVTAPAPGRVRPTGSAALTMGVIRASAPSSDPVAASMDTGE